MTKTKRVLIRKVGRSKEVLWALLVKDQAMQSNQKHPNTKFHTTQVLICRSIKKQTAATTALTMKTPSILRFSKTSKKSRIASRHETTQWFWHRTILLWVKRSKQDLLWDSNTRSLSDRLALPMSKMLRRRLSSLIPSIRKVVNERIQMLVWVPKKTSKTWLGLRLWTSLSTKVQDHSHKWTPKVWWWISSPCSRHRCHKLLNQCKQSPSQSRTRRTSSRCRCKFLHSLASCLGNNTSIITNRCWPSKKTVSNNRTLRICKCCQICLPLGLQDSSNHICSGRSSCSLLDTTQARINSFKTMNKWTY